MIRRIVVNSRAGVLTDWGRAGYLLIIVLDLAADYGWVKVGSHAEAGLVVNLHYVKLKAIITRVVKARIIAA